MTKPYNRVSLVIPGLLGPQTQYPLLEPHERPVLKNSASLLSRATRSEAQNRDWLSTVWTLLRPNLHSAPIPFAAISAGYDRLPDVTTSWCLRIDPVHLRIDMDSAIMLAADDLTLTDEEVNELTSSINEHLKQDGIKIYVAHPHRWYLLFDSPRKINTTPLHQVMGKDVHGFLPQGDEHQYWRSLLNEIQMLLYTHPVNQQREQRGLASVNSVWFWGEGALPVKNQTEWDEIYTDNHLVEILADFYGIPCYALNLYQHQSDVKQNVMLVMTGLEILVHNRDIFEWIKELNTLDASLFKKIHEDFKKRHLQFLSLFPCNQQKFDFSLSQSRTWWKRNKPWAHFLTT